MKRLLMLMIAALATMGACSAADDGDGTIAGLSSPEEADTTTSTTTTLPVLAAPARYVPVTGEPEPEAKTIAADVLQAVGTYEVGDAVAGLTGRAAGFADPATVAGATALLDDAVASSIEIVYPQLGGLTDTEAAIMLVYRQITLDREGQRTEETRTADVRLVRSPTGWSVSEIASIGLAPAGSAPLSPAAEAVLSNPAIDLPASARWDIEAGIVDDRVLDVLSRVAAVAPVGVTSFKTGHPMNVFGASYVSNHTEGRAVDIWAFDGQPVVLQRAAGSALQEVVRQLVAEGAVTELGAPWDLDGPGGPSFANTVHQDHLHLAFDD